ncbi:hypothetical protein ABI59_03820 [Acidobacteria bacterium Mor1]|nr:hypothetical protein ABI59_03820 [Acidobacteria bacterium Mor1]
MKPPMNLRVRLAGILALVLALTGALSCAGDASPRSGVVLVVLDTTRADHFSSMGYPRETTPNFDRLADESRLYRNAWSQAPWTLPSFASIVTGVLPRHHGAGMKPSESGARQLQGVRPEVPTMAELLSRAGYATAAWVNVVFCNPGTGISRGFDVYDFHTSDASNQGHRDARATTDAALRWAESVGERDFLMMVHYFDPHLVYDPPAPFDTRFEPAGASALPRGFGHARELFALRRGEIELTPGEKGSLIARYDGELAFADEQFGRLRAGLERMGLWEDSLVIVVADHGEEFWDHGGFEHGHSHHRELLHVPLIVKRPGESPESRFDRVRQIDILPTVLDYAGIDGPPLPGGVLGSVDAPFAIAEGSLWGGDLVSIRGDEGTLIQEQDGSGRLFYAADDPDERRSVLDRDATAAESLAGVLSLVPAPGQGRLDVDLDPEELQILRDLGYVE